MRKVEAGMVESIRDSIHSDKSGQVFKSGNTTVSIIHEGIRGTYSYRRTIEVALHDNVIAGPGRGQVKGTPSEIHPKLGSKLISFCCFPHMFCCAI